MANSRSDNSFKKSKTIVTPDHFLNSKKIRIWELHPFNNKLPEVNNTVWLRQNSIQVIIYKK